MRSMFLLDFEESVRYHQGNDNLGAAERSKSQGAPMKKQTQKKLKLHRETLRELELGIVVGGTDRAWTGCDSACTECPTVNPTAVDTV